MMNKNKAKITKSIQEAIKAKEEILRDPKNHPGNYGDLGRKIGGTIGVGGGLLAAHKLKKFSTAGKEWAGFKGDMKGALKGEQSYSPRIRTPKNSPGNNSRRKSGGRGNWF